jgi:hypothetical protein
MFRFLGAAIFAAMILGCTTAQDREDAANAEAPWRQPGDVIDSILPMDEQFRRFREGLTEATTLTGGASSRDALVASFVRAVEQRDTSLLRDLLMSRAEFAWLYAPQHEYARPPYEMPPGLFWFQLQQQSEKGIGRVLQRLGGRPLQYTGYRCDPASVVTIGNGRTYGGCVLSFTRPDIGPDTMALFRGIYELDGRFKFISYSNAF